MSAPLILPRPANAPVLDEYRDYIQPILQTMRDSVGDGTAQGLTSAKLRAMDPTPSASGALANNYQAAQAQITLYQNELNSLDDKIADIAQKSAELSGSTNSQVTGLIDVITGILAAACNQPSLNLQQQLDVIGSIDDAVNTAEQKVSQAVGQNQAHGDAVAQSAPTTGTPAPANYSGGSNYPNSLGGNDSPAASRYNAAGGGSPSSAEPIAAGKKAQVSDIYQYLITRYGFTPAQAAGILGNMQTESGFNTGSFNPQEGAIGLCQWEGGRRQQLEQFAAAQGKSVTDWHVQVDYMMSELHGGESGAYAHVKSAQTPGAAAAAFDQYYERSSGAARGERIANATSIATSMASIAV
ncbi:MAG: hypothetical protein JWN03_4103 [Nocardia sp.]|uniref:phage tail tip lysozyme n=1 Tax=Nocardia sp. TaxID=1821 RepID=UPI0026302EB0|nr:phage tail tip lysozyme [Nocardia sp.]MCU1643828.1 hypothetical protein [Nocardia sp.]